MDVHVHGSRHLAQLAGDLVGNLVVLVHVAPSGDLHVDGRGQAEVEDLADDVGGLEVEVHARELGGQFAPEPLGEFEHRGFVPGIERDLDLTVSRADGCTVAEGEVHAADRQADVVDYQVQFLARHDRTDVFLYLPENPLGLLDARAGRRPDVQAELPGVHLREEVAADERDQAQRHGE